MLIFSTGKVLWEWAFFLYSIGRDEKNCNFFCRIFSSYLCFFNKQMFAYEQKYICIYICIQIILQNIYHSFEMQEDRDWKKEGKGVCVYVCVWGGATVMCESIANIWIVPQMPAGAPAETRSQVQGQSLHINDENSAIETSILIASRAFVSRTVRN